MLRKTLRVGPADAEGNRKLIQHRPQRIGILIRPDHLWQHQESPVAEGCDLAYDIALDDDDIILDILLSKQKVIRTPICNGADHFIH